MKYILYVLAFASFSTLAQNKPGTELHIRKATSEITLDGQLNEPEWSSADVAKNWFLNYPVDSIPSPFQTEARLTFNEHFLYVSFVCYDDQSPDMINSLRRDFDYDLNDNVGMNIGPYNDRLNGFFFVLTPKGVQMEGTVAAGGSTVESYGINWDNKWYSKVVRYPDKWIAEIAIPFKSFRYKSGLRQWNITFDRSDKKRNLKSSWIHTPIQYVTGSFAYSGNLIWDDPMPPAHTNVSFIPFVAGSMSADNEVKPSTSDSDLQVGFDAKVAVTPSLNLDLTANPDFSQVEVDQQVINLTRFEFKFPERRQFFLENSDLFDRAGFPEARVFFSRRIGLVRDTSGLYKRVPIAFGARLSGSLNGKWRLSMMNMQTKVKESMGLPAQNYTVATLQRNFWKQSNIAFTYVDKETLGVGAGDSTRFFQEGIFRRTMMGGQNNLQPNLYNRAFSVDAEMLSQDNKWYNSTFFAHSFDGFNQTDRTAGGSFLQYQQRNITFFTGPSYVGKNFNAEAGYVPSRGVYPGQLNYYTEAAYRFYPKSERIVVMSPRLSLTHTYIPGGTLTDRMYTVSYNFNFRNTATLLMAYNYVYQRMTNNFTPLYNADLTQFLVGEEYAWHNGSVTLQTNTRKLLNFKGQTTFGGFYNGQNINVNGQISYRYQPYGNVSLRFDFNDVRLPANYGKEKLFLIGPRFDLTFTDKIFLTTYVQYNNLLDNVNLNARFQWRYKPASDFFIVYTENYFSDSFASKNKALVFKLTYWLNI